MPRPDEGAPRSALRLRGGNLTAGPAYFLTISTGKGQLLFGHIQDVRMHYTPGGDMAARVWRSMPQHSRGLLLDEFIVMPNHIHAIFGFAVPEPLKPDSPPPKPPPDEVRIGRLLKNFRMMSAQEYTEGVREAGWPRFEGKLWDGAERLRRLDTLTALNECRDYITENPARWLSDRLNPQRVQ